MPKRRDSATFSAKSTLKLPGERTKPLVPTGKIRQKSPSETFSSLSEAQVDNLCGKGKWPVYLDFHEDMFCLAGPDFLGHCKDVVKEIDFSSNLLTTFHSASHLTKLRRLHLTNNELTDARLSGLVSLEFLSLARNKLEVIPDMVSLRSLVHLDLSSNLCQRGFSQFQHLKSLRVLDLSRNSLELTPSQLYHYILVFLKRLPKLEYLSFEDNPVSQTVNYRPFIISELPKLKYLDWKEVSKDERHKAEHMDFKSIKDNIPAASGGAGSSSMATLNYQAKTPVGEPPSSSSQPKVNSLSSFDTPSVPPPQPPGASPDHNEVMDSLDDILNEISEQNFGGPPSSNRGVGGNQMQELDPLDDVLGLLDEPSSPPNQQPLAQLQPGGISLSSFDEKFGQPPDLNTRNDSLQYFDDLLDVLDTPSGQQPQQQPHTAQPQQQAPPGGENPLQYFDDLFQILNENPNQPQSQEVAPPPQQKKESTPDHDNPHLFDELTSILEDNEWSGNNRNNPSVLVPPPSTMAGTGPATPPPPQSATLPPPLAASPQKVDIDDELFDVLGDILDSKGSFSNAAPPQQEQQRAAPEQQDGSDLMDELDMILQDFPLDPVSSGPSKSSPVSSHESPLAGQSTKQQQQNLDDEIARLLGEPPSPSAVQQEQHLRPGAAAQRDLSPRSARTPSPRKDEERDALLMQLESGLDQSFGGGDELQRWEEEKKAEMEFRLEEERMLREAEENARRAAEVEVLQMEEERRRRQEEDRLRRIEEERQRKEEEDRRMEEERQREMERIRAEEELLAREEEERQKRIEEERLIREAEEKRREEERRRREEARLRLEEERKRRDEEARLKAEEELRRREEEERRLKEEEDMRRRAAEERLREEEERRRQEAEERRRIAEEQRILEEQERRRRQEEEEKRREEEERFHREEEERREQERLEARRKAEEELAKRRAELEERRRAAEQRRIEEEERRRVLQEQLLREEEERRQEEERRRLEEEEKLRAQREANEQVLRQKENERIQAEERRRQQDEEERRAWLARMAEKEAERNQEKSIDQYINMQITGGVTLFGSLPEPEEASLPADLVKEMKEAPSWDMKACDVVTQERLGTGTFGSVYTGVWNHRKVTVKNLTCQRFDQDFLFRLKQEVPTMVNMDHPNVMQLLGVVTDGTIQTVGEYVHGQALYGFLRTKGTELSGDVCIDILRGIAGGLEYLHNNNVVHRALKSKNVMMTEEGIPKIRDYGFGEIKDAVLATGSIVSPNYSAPELLVRIGRESGGAVSKAVDIFSFAMLSWEVFTRQTPLGDLMPRQVLKALLAGERPPILPCIPLVLQRLIPACWQGEGGRRPTIDKILRILNGPLEKLLQYEPAYTGSPSRIPASSSSPTPNIMAGGAQSFTGSPSSGSFSNLNTSSPSSSAYPGVGGRSPYHSPNHSGTPNRSQTFSDYPGVGGGSGSFYGGGSAGDQKTHHVLKRLIDLLSAPYPQSQIKALKATANIAPTLTNPAAVKESGIVPLIINLNSGPDNVKENVLIALHAICSNEMLCSQAVESGGIQVCASFLHVQNNVLVLNSTKVLTRIAEVPLHREVLRAASVIAALLQLLDSNYNEAIRQQVLLCLCQLLEEDACLHDFVELGGAAKLPHLVKGNHPGIVLRGFVLLSMLYKSPSPQVQQAYRDSGAVSRFVAFLKSTTPMLLLEGSKGMVRFSLMENYREEVARMGGIAPLIAALTNENSEATYHCCLALKNFCQEERYRKFIRQSGGLAILLAIMQRRDSENSQELQICAEVLSLLVADEEAGAVLLSQGSVPLLLGNLTSPTAEVRKASLTALAGAVASDGVCDAVGQAVSAHTFSALLSSSDEDVASDAVKVLARVSERTSLAQGLMFDVLNLICQLLRKEDQATAISAATVLALAAIQGNIDVGKSILDSQTTHLFLGQLRIAPDYQLVNLLKGTSTLVTEVTFGQMALREGIADAIASVLKRKNPLFCSVAFRILLTLGTTPEAKLHLVESPVNFAIQEMMSDPGTDPRLVMAAERVIGSLHS